VLHLLRAVAALLVVVCAVAGAAHAQTCTAPSGVCAERVAFGFTAPVYLAAPAGDPRLFVVERAGRIRIVENGVVQAQAFLDIASAVNDDVEGGLLGLAFAPDYATSGVFYVYYTAFSESSAADMRSVVSRFTVTGDPATSNDADEASETPIFELDQPYPNHNGGTIAIRDGFLYFGLGDGGQGGDPEERAQDDASLFGKMLRLDLALADPTTEDWTVWAKGLRNPFRFSFDRATGDLYIGDVGQREQEEVDAVPDGAAPGLNFGWDVMEGNLCFADGAPEPNEPPCNDPSLFDPTFTYDHPGDIPGAIAGGAVYRGGRSPSLRGWYFFADTTRTLFFRLRWTAAGGLLESEELTGRIQVDAGSLLQPVAIAEDGVGELHVVGLNGQIHRLVPEPAAALGGLVSLAALRAVRGTRRAT
jgi:hypothetical protein